MTYNLHKKVSLSHFTDTVTEVKVTDLETDKNVACLIYLIAGLQSLYY